MVQTNKSKLEFNRYGEINEEFEPAPISDNANVGELGRNSRLAIDW